MSDIPVRRQGDNDPRAGAWFDPLGRDRRPRREAAAPLEVFEASDGTVTIITRNQT